MADDMSAVKIDDNQINNESIKSDYFITNSEIKTKNCDLVNNEKSEFLLYDLNRKPSFILSTFLALQAILVSLLNLIWLPLSLTPFLCMHNDDPATIEIVSLSMFSSGLGTLFFSSIGIKLPIMLLPNVEYISQLLNILQRAELKCPGRGDLYAMGPLNRTAEWQSRFTHLQGGLLIGSLLQILVGLSGISCIFDSILSNPIVLIPSTIVVGHAYANQIMNLTTIPEIPIVNGSVSWGTIFLTIGVLIIVSLRFRNLEFITPTYTRAKGFTTTTLRLFQLLPILVTSVIVLVIYPVLCKLVYGSQNDTSQPLEQSLHNSDLFYIHKPFPFGWPTFNLDSFIYLLPAVINQIFLSALVYRVTNFFYGINVKSRYVSRGILIEGISSTLSGLFGMNSVSSPINIGLMQLTRVGNRQVIQLFGVFLIIFSMCNKFLRFFINISPLFVLCSICVLSAMILVTGFHMMPKSNLTSVRSCTVIGLSTYAGIVLPKLISSITSENVLIQILLVFISSNLIICSTLAVILNYMLPKETNNQHIEGDEESNEKYTPSPCEEILAMCI